MLHASVSDGEGADADSIGKPASNIVLTKLTLCYHNYLYFPQKKMGLFQSLSNAKKIPCRFGVRVLCPDNEKVGINGNRLSSKN